MRMDEAIFVTIVLAAALIGAFAVAELLAQALQPVSDALMAAARDANQALP